MSRFASPTRYPCGVRRVGRSRYVAGNTDATSCITHFARADEHAPDVEDASSECFAISPFVYGLAIWIDYRRTHSTPELRVFLSRREWIYGAIDHAVNRLASPRYIDDIVRPARHGAEGAEGMLRHRLYASQGIYRMQRRIRDSAPQGCRSTKHAAHDLRAHSRQVGDSSCNRAKHRYIGSTPRKRM